MIINNLSEALAQTWLVSDLANYHYAEENKPNGLIYKVAQLQAEAAEVSVEVMQMDRYKTPKTDLDGLITRAQEEVGDVLVMAFDIAKDLDMTETDICAVIAKGLEQWRKKHIEAPGK